MTGGPRPGGAGGGGIGLGAALLITFVVLKLCGVISWSWWWVLSPIWISAALAVLCGLIAGLLFVVVSWPDRGRGRGGPGRAAPHVHGPAHRWRPGGDAWEDDRD